MAERTGRSGVGSTAQRFGHSAPPIGPSAPPPPPPVKPCWVTDRHGRLPGLLLGWRAQDGGWHGRVVRPVLEAGEWYVVEDWLPAERLEPG